MKYRIREALPGHYVVENKKTFFFISWWATVFYAWDYEGNCHPRRFDDEESAKKALEEKLKEDDKKVKGVVCEGDL